ncbi:Tight junction-associated protein 1 [Frankliniella fusca]|uniref:Tight junction-associated protein 1 n=1 Tax=Frankliniella fusca TaxID=407009 RepID=A0AAE1LK60_9NEOP|nr:Tight junction-associated protein 1 [Frankliniella fusca]
MAEQCCKECGCLCRRCDQSTLHLHVEIENLKQRLVERERDIVTMETNFLSEADKFPDGEYAALTEELLTWQEKYSRLYESYKRVQKVNQGLEDKLLRVVDKFESEKAALTRDVASLTQRLVDARFNVNRYQEENERYRNDLNLAIQFLQCKPANFVSQKFEQLPTELQQKVRTYMTSKRRPSESGCPPAKVERRTIKVPIPTFPPTAMVYSVNKAPSEKDMSDEEREVGEGKPPVDIVSAAILAKILEERERERHLIKHCSSCSCSSLLKVDANTQTDSFSHSSNSPSSPALMNLRYSSSLLGSGEASQVLVSLTDDSSGLTIPSSQCSSVKQSPRNSIVTSQLEDDRSDSQRLNHLNNINRSFEMTSWDDWNVNVADSPKTQETKQTESNSSQIPDSILAFPKQEFNMPKVSVNNSPGICRVNTTVMPSPSGTPVASIWNKTEVLSAADGIASKRTRIKAKAVNNQDYLVNTHSSKSHENHLKGIEFNSVGEFKSDNISQNHKVLHNAPSKLNQTRLLPETKLFASGDMVEVLPTDSLMYSVECERRIGQISLKNVNSSSPSGDRKDKEKDSRPLGPRPCSLRFQAGSNNILLDNAQSYEPVLYTSRQANANPIISPRVNDSLVVGSRLDSASCPDDLTHSSSNGSDPIISSGSSGTVQLSQRTETGV